ncbi:MAG: hypothetical protein AVDCRST_MAG18-2368, partial [uncultured Thermomicrobiales bacterium]
ACRDRCAGRIWLGRWHPTPRGVRSARPPAHGGYTALADRSRSPRPAPPQGPLGRVGRAGRAAAGDGESGVV